MPQLSHLAFVGLELGEKLLGGLQSGTRELQAPLATVTRGVSKNGERRWWWQWPSGEARQWMELLE